MTLREEILKNANIINEAVESDFDTDSKKCLGNIYKTFLKYKALVESHKNERALIIEDFRDLKEDIAGFCDDIIEVYEGKV